MDKDLKEHRAAHWMKRMKRIFMEGACDRFILNVVETECFFNFDGRLPRSGGGLYRRKRRKLAWGLVQKKAAEAGLRQASSVQAPRNAVPLNQNSF